MAVRDLEKFNKLSRLTNDSFGSDGLGSCRVSTQHIKIEIIDEHTLKFNYQSIVNFATKSMLRDLMSKHKYDALELIKITTKKVPKHSPYNPTIHIKTEHR